MPVTLKHDEVAAKRDAKGRFLPGHRPPRSPGRPPGPNGAKARAARIAGEHLEEMLGMAATVVQDALSDGNTQVATWLIDRVRPPGRSDTVMLDGIGPLKTLEDIIAASEETLRNAATGRISLQDATAFLALLTRHAEIKSVEALEDLKAAQENLKASLASGQKQDTSHHPAWGKLR